MDLLRDGPLTTGQICKQMPGLSRFAVMQHLGVLADGGLVLFRKEGRQRFNYANPVPLREIYERWVSMNAAIAAETSQHLKRYAESRKQEDSRMSKPEEHFRVVKIELETEIDAAPQIVFDALTVQMDAWWPHRMNPEGVITHDARVGGTIREEWPAGGAVYGAITVFEAGKRCSSVAHGFGGACTIVNDDLVEARGQGAVYRKSMRLWGDVPQELEDMFRQGAAAIAQKALRAFCEQGVGRNA